MGEQKIPGYPDKYAGLKREIKVTLFRMWAAGAVCFFAAWGRLAPEEPGDLFSMSVMVSLIFLMVITDMLIVNPVIRLVSGKRLWGDEKPGWRLFLKTPLNIIRVTILVLLIVQTYYLLNVFFIHVYGLDEDVVPVQLEPILFGFMYGLYYFLYNLIIKVFMERVVPVFFTGKAL